jgi:hypothetical protein
LRESRNIDAGQPFGGSCGVFTSNLKEDAMAKKAKKKKAAKKKKK